MRSCSNCQHWIKGQQYNLGACTHPERLVYLGGNDGGVFSLMFAHQNCDRHEQKNERKDEK